MVHSASLTLAHALLILGMVTVTQQPNHIPEPMYASVGAERGGMQL